MNHTHNHCKHNNLKYCEMCHVVYCENCGREWVKSYGYHSPTYTGVSLVDNSVLLGEDESLKMPDPQKITEPAEVDLKNEIKKGGDII